MIRYITMDDLDWLVEITTEFNDQYYKIPLNITKTIAALTHLITSPYGVAFRTDRGAIVGTIEDDPFRDYVVLQERGWYSTDRTGIALLKHFTAYGKELGVNEVRVCNLEINPSVKRVLAKEGYIPIETSHGLRL